jgi:hypothetical protein
MQYAYLAPKPLALGSVVFLAFLLERRACRFPSCMGSIWVSPDPLPPAASNAILPMFLIIIFMRLKSSMNSEACTRARARAHTHTHTHVVRHVCVSVCVTHTPIVASGQCVCARVHTDNNKHTHTHTHKHTHRAKSLWQCASTYRERTKLI